MKVITRAREGIFYYLQFHNVRGHRVNLSFPFTYFPITLSVLIGSLEKKKKMITDSLDAPAILRFIKRRGNLINKRRTVQ